MKVLLAYARAHLRPKLRRRKKAAAKRAVDPGPAILSEKAYYEPQPPSYQECVAHPAPPLREKTAVAERGRPREILYRSQLNDFLERKETRHTLPPVKVRPFKRIARENVDYGALLRNQANAAVWTGHFGLVQLMFWIFLAFLLMVETTKVVVGFG